MFNLILRFEFYLNLITFLDLKLVSMVQKYASPLAILKIIKSLLSAVNPHAFKNDVLQSAYLSILHHLRIQQLQQQDSKSPMED
jgi:hypothetical protein